jgi:hypothetical protein
MAWIKTAERMPPEEERILIHDERNKRIEFGRYIKGRWYIENLRNGQLSEIAGVRHRGWVLDSEINDGD